MVNAAENSEDPNYSEVVLMEMNKKLLT